MASDWLSNHWQFSVTKDHCRHGALQLWTFWDMTRFYSLIYSLVHSLARSTTASLCLVELGRRGQVGWCSCYQQWTVLHIMSLGSGGNSLKKTVRIYHYHTNEAEHQWRPSVALSAATPPILLWLTACTLITAQPFLHKGGVKIGVCNFVFPRWLLHVQRHNYIGRIKVSSCAYCDRTSPDLLLSKWLVLITVTYDVEHFLLLVELKDRVTGDLCAGLDWPQECSDCFV